MKRFYVFILLLSAFFLLNATNINVFGGLGISFLTGDVSRVTLITGEEIDIIPAKASYGIGASLDIPVGSMILEPGLRFISGGSLYKENTRETINGAVWMDYKYEETLTLNYLDIFAKVKFSSGSLKPYVGLGLPILLSAKLDTKMSDFGVSINDNNTDVKDFYAGTNFNLMIGADLVLLEKIIIGAGYSRHLNNILTKGDKSVNLNNFMLNIGYKFDLNR